MILADWSSTITSANLIMTLPNANRYYDGLALSSPLALANPAALEGRGLRILGEKGALQTATAQHYDASKQRIILSKAVRWSSRTAVRFHIGALVESRVLFRGVTARADLDTPHRVLKKSGVQYLIGALQRCLGVEAEQLRIVVVSMGAKNVQASR